jgi:methyl-accepting chemotaxis protein
VGEEKRRQVREEAMQRANARSSAKRQQLAERIATSTNGLMSGLDHAKEASEKLNEAMQRISFSAVQCIASAHESQEASNRLASGASNNSAAVQQCMRRIESLQTLLRTTTAGIVRLVESVTIGAERNVQSTKMISDLQRQAEAIGQVVKTVAGIADQTNLLALNAAIEAARAGEHGRGFAVVADEVRNLAEGAERSASDIRELIGSIQGEVETVTQDTQRASDVAREEVRKGEGVIAQLQQVERDASEIEGRAREINELSAQVTSSIQEFRRGTETIVASSEEASAASAEAQRSTEEHNKALAEIQSATEELASLAEQLRVNTDSTKTSETMAASAEELSATIAETSSSSQQIVGAINEIGRGAQEQATATEQASRAIRVISETVSRIDDSSRAALEMVASLNELLSQNKASVDSLVEGVVASGEASRMSAQNVTVLEQRIRRIDRIVDAISSVAMKTDMLAVNGGIEAGRAGEYGRGFAVVAADIRSLATDSAENAQKIKDLVRNIQDSIEQVARVIVQLGAEAENEVKSARKTSEDLTTVMNHMMEVLTGVEEVAANIVSAKQSVDSAGASIEEIAQAAAQAQSAADEASAAAERQAEAMAQLSQSIEEVAALADEMQS